MIEIIDVAIIANINNLKINLDNNAAALFVSFNRNREEYFPVKYKFTFLDMINSGNENTFCMVNIKPAASCPYIK